MVASDSDIEEENEMEKHLAEVPLGELQKARADGSLSTYRSRARERVFGRANKNRPTEISSKVPVKRFKEVIQVPKKVCRDPRFETLCGTFDQDGFRNRYNFLFDENLPAEKKKLQMMIKKSRDPKAKEDLQKNIAWIDNKIKSAPASSKNLETWILSEHKKIEREAARKGKMPFYLKKGEIRERKLVQKYNELKSSGKLESFIDKRRKKNAAKDHRYMPYRRSDNLQ